MSNEKLLYSGTITAVEKTGVSSTGSTEYYNLVLDDIQQFNKQSYQSSFKVKPSIGALVNIVRPDGWTSGSKIVLKTPMGNLNTPVSNTVPQNNGSSSSEIGETITGRVTNILEAPVVNGDYKNYKKGIVVNGETYKAGMPSSKADLAVGDIVTLKKSKYNWFISKVESAFDSQPSVQPEAPVANTVTPQTVNLVTPTSVSGGYTEKSETPIISGQKDYSYYISYVKDIAVACINNGGGPEDLRAWVESWEDQARNFIQRNS